LEVHIFSGEAPGAVYHGLRGSPGGTAIRTPKSPGALISG
jgi:hypothetical protein